ncbi:PadR family transcriptional regulator [Paenibacillus sinopodophylli]|uniref:PadR family transcriptional regulator n=1 Tax=Paenibacillus sinopodophylli TaxID=1837342 RepID=UPI00110D0E67|nr:PadR family transcriptional regulator [Paenibacillus sinopodophylli]
MRDEWQLEERLFLQHEHGRDANGSGRRFFSRGGVKYALLELLEQESMHGYQMMKALEEQSGGTYKPSAGSIYPTLQMLRDQGLVDSSKLEGKKIFEITDSGRVYLQEEKESPTAQPDRHERHSRKDNGGSCEHHKECSHNHHKGDSCGHQKPNRRLTPAGKELLHLLKAAERAAVSDSRKASQLRNILDQLRLSLRQIAADSEDDGL